MKTKECMCDAPSFALPVDQNPEPHAPMKYGHTRVPHPTNEKAKVTNHDEVMNQVMQAK
jgi:hypothetical protein